MASADSRDARIRQLTTQLKDSRKKLKDSRKKLKDAESLNAVLLGQNAKSASTKKKLPNIPEEERTPSVLKLLEKYHLLLEQFQALKDEIARLKGLKPKPKIKPSRLEDPSRNGEKDKKPGGKRPGSAKRSKTAKLKIHEERIVKAENLPTGSIFKGYQDFTVQDIIIRIHNTRFRLETWVTPEGKNITAKLPDGVAVGHFGTTLVSHILYEYYQKHVTQPLILEHLWEIKVDISAGQVNRIITEGKERFHTEKAEILRVGLEVSNYVNVDDTGARHNGKNGYCTHIGNELFAWFASTDSKSRVNFLELLRAGNTDYILNEVVLAYMEELKLPKVLLGLLAANEKSSFENEAEWKAALQSLGFTDKRHIRIATEGALLGSVLEHGINPRLVILSDDAGQFNVFLLLHALCWIHAERTINKLVPFNDEQREALEKVRTQIWDFYDELKAYKEAPTYEKKVELEARFDEIFSSKTCYATLNQALERLRRNKSELLLVLECPDIPLHNNLSEGDIREFVKTRKISGSTRSTNGRRCRDTFASLKKTCRKLGISFWEYLKDRVSGKNSIPELAELIRRRAAALAGHPT